jgi:AcrR family transcriptional regulator
MSRNGGPPAPALDPRARRSKEALATALLALVADRDLNAISISDITKLAGVSRSTFYEHFADVHDLAATACLQVFDRLVADAPMIDPKVLESRRAQFNPLVPLFGHFAEHAALYRSLLGPDGSARVINHLMHRISVRAYTNIRIEGWIPPDPAADPAEIPYDPESALAASVIIGAVMDWLRAGCPISSDELAQAVWPPLLAAVAAANGPAAGLIPPSDPA